MLSLPRTTTSNVRVDTALTSSSWSLRGVRVGWCSNIGVTEPDLLKSRSISEIAVFRNAIDRFVEFGALRPMSPVQSRSERGEA